MDKDTHSVLLTFKERDDQVLKIMKKTSDNYAVYTYLKYEGPLTAYQAITSGISFDLKSRIADLQKYGAIIDSKRAEGKRHHIYTLNKEDGE